MFCFLNLNYNNLAQVVAITSTHKACKTVYIGNLCLNFDLKKLFGYFVSGRMNF